MYICCPLSMTVAFTVFMVFIRFIPHPLPIVVIVGNTMRDHAGTVHAHPAKMV